MESAALQFPWRQLGELLVAEELLTEDELEQALSEQAASGRLLGQIIVANGYLSAFSLARVLSQQHGVQLVKSAEEAASAALNLLGNSLVTIQTGPEGQTVRQVLVAVRDSLSKLDAAFFTMNGIISMAFLSCVLLERLVNDPHITLIAGPK